MGMKRDEYVEKLKNLIDEWNGDIDKLQAKAMQAQADARGKIDKQIEELKSKRQALEGKIAVLHKASEGAWKDMKSGTDMALQALGEAVKSAKSRFK